MRIRARRGHQIAAVATARKMAVHCWHLLTKQEDYAWIRPALHARKPRELELKAGFPSQKGGNKRGKAYDYNFRHVREQERRFTERAERAYERFVKGWQPKGPHKNKTSTIDLGKKKPAPQNPIKRTDATNERAY